jgi:hypothetical protein
LNFAVSDASRANSDAFGSAVDNGPYGLQIDIPAALGHVVRVADPIAELGPTPAHITYFGHGRFTPRVEIPVYQFGQGLATDLIFWLDHPT